VAGGALLPAGAARAANLIANPGFETAGSTGTVFTDTLPDLAAWQITSGNFTLAAGSLTSQGMGPSTDAAVVRNSQDYQDGTLSMTVVPVTVAPQETGGLVVRYQDASNFYLCGLTKNSLIIQRRLAGTDTVIGSTSFTSAAGSSYTVSASAAGSSLTCKVTGPGGTSATATATDTSFTHGMIGIAAINSNPSQLRQTTFSQPATMTAAVPQSWSGLVRLAGRPGLIPDSVAPANSGSSYLQLFGGAGTFSAYAQQTPIAVTGGASYTISAAIRTDAVSGAAKVLVIEPGGTTTTLASVSGTTAWTVYAASFTTQPATTSVTVRLELDGSGRGSFDDLSLAITPSVSLSVSSSSVNFGGVDPLSSPFTLTRAATATVTSNSNWALSLQGAGNFSDGTGKTFPLSQLAWRVNGGASFAPVSTSAQAVTSGAPNTPAGTATPLDFQLQVTYADPVSSQPFNTTVTYTATTP
jgi:hypothetical protein